MTGQIFNTPLELEQVTLEDLSNAVNGALGRVGFYLRQHKFGKVEIEMILNDALAAGVQEMREGQEKRKKGEKLVRLVQ